jgi:YidC/Oxa1 family membrane protein insertase
MPDAKKKSSTMQFILLFLVLYLGIQLVMGQFMPKTPEVAPVAGPRIEATGNFTIGHHPTVRVVNVPATSTSHGIGGWFSSKWCSITSFFGVEHAGACADLAVTYTGETFTLASRCPSSPLDVYTIEADANGVEKQTQLTATETTVDCVTDPVVVTPGTNAVVSLAPWKYSMFEKVGTYEVRMPGSKQTGTGAIAAGTVARFQISDPSFLTKAFRTFISAPFLNFLIFIASFMPGHNLGVAILILTILVKLLLFIPTQHSLEGQKKMQLLQPKFEAVKRKYADDNAKIQEETMKLWKEYKINPFQSCLPILIQFPVLIGLLYVIRDESNLALSQHLIYPVYQHLTWHFGTSFLWLDLLKPDFYVMPVLLVVLQFLQFKLSFSIAKRKKRKETIGTEIQEVKDAAEGDPMSQQELQQKIMMYGLPLMIGFFAIKFPSAVALYWGISTLFAIGQQIIVNREHLRV